MDNPIKYICYKPICEKRLCKSVVQQNDMNKAKEIKEKWELTRVYIEFGPQ